jgi:hypothetical protein
MSTSVGQPLDCAEVCRGSLGAALCGLPLLDLDGLATAVPAAARTGVMTLLWLVAVRALLQLRRHEREMRPAIALAGM